MDYIIIEKYLAGTASEDEVKVVFQWLETSSENKNEFIQYKKIWAMTSKSGENPGKIWDHVLLKKIRTKDKSRNLYRYTKYAAVILIIFSLGMVVQYILSERLPERHLFMVDMQIEAPPGQMSNVVLPDGTTVQLNSESRLTCSANFNSGTREVTLEGEAFFEVVKDSIHPFLVKTRALDFKVYGTSFNIQAYPEDQEINTTLVEGSLGVIDKNGSELTRLVSGENAKYREGEAGLVINKVDLSLYTSWKDGLITFSGLSLKDIAGKIERWYNVEIIIANPKLEDELYLGTIMKNKPVDQILEVFRLTSSLKYRIVHRPDKPTLIYWE